MTDGQDIFADFGRRLAAEGVVEEVSEGFLIKRLYGIDFDPPVRLHTTATSLKSLVERMGDVGHDVFPQSPIETAALQLLFVHLEEELTTRPAGASTLVVDADGVRWERAGDDGNSGR